MFKTNKMFLGRYIFGFFALLLVTPISAQLIGTPELFFSNICPMEGASAEYEVAFEVDPSRFNPDNEFFVELSDADGVFLVDLIEILTTVTNDENESLVYAKFKFDKPLYGENYRIRIESSSPTAFSTPSTSFNGFSIGEINLVLNNGEDIVMNSTTNQATIAVAGSTDKKYHWYKNGAFFEETDGQELTVSEPGLYYVSTYYGECTGSDFSNVVKVTNASGSGKSIPLQKVVSPNGDSFNDYWKLPKELSGRDIRVTILNQNGNVILDTDSYENNWPQNSGGDNKGFHRVVYYVLREKGKLLGKGSITITQ
ncbi:T9SS type B sorting domain-containing protein [Spongiivirga citrea]|uniref:Gliding motility-associated C-terminal domain-containing protein n=1 Tax=Spongiivirga citrea TaxID=1481457 RepID=A0A6M0CLU2_9FLAO|nr:gliding motility-associated C-terminal domain-containing protein [Spongiivirga citrea]NER16397.1 hypothetical protein [Spongiivirga citrea]